MTTRYTPTRNNYQLMVMSLKRLCLLLDGADCGSASPQRLSYGDKVVFMRGTRTAVLLPAFPQEWTDLLVKSPSVHVGKDGLTSKRPPQSKNPMAPFAKTRNGKAGGMFDGVSPSRKLWDDLSEKAANA